MKGSEEMRRTHTRVFGTILVALLFGAATLPAMADMTTTLPRRIVSLAPSATEVLFDLGLGSKVVGVTRFCDYPSSTSAITKVGGLMDTNYEAILSLKPDLTVLLVSQRDTKRELEKMKLKMLLIPDETLEGIHKAIRSVGEACGAQAAAIRLLDNLTSRSEAVRRAVQERPRPRVLICVGRDVESSSFSGLYVAGRHSFYDEIIEAAGGVNAYTDEKVAYPQLAAEGVIRLNPDVIVDLVGMVKPAGKTAEQIARQWDQLRLVAAVRQHRVHVIVGNHALRPGPRYIQFLEELAHILHPEAFKEATAHE
jgi:iron complex transport system substrate-binding protein